MRLPAGGLVAGIFGVVRMRSDEAEGITVQLKPPAWFVMRQRDVPIDRKGLVEKHIAKVRCSRAVAQTRRENTARHAQIRRARNAAQRFVTLTRSRNPSEAAQWQNSLRSIASAFSDIIMNSASGHSLNP